MSRRGAMVASACALVLGLVCAPGIGRAQGPSTAPDAGDAITVSVLTMGQGDEVWERFGHNALRIQDRTRGTDIAYNWGMFSFRQENFFLNFARGHMRYWMQGFDNASTVAMYEQAGRSVVAQELNLTAAEKVALRDAMLATDTDEHRYYRYDYYRDNCSTRVRDAIDHVIGGQLKAFTDSIPTANTWRTLTREETISDFPVYLGLQTLLGRPVDRRLTAWESMFLPFRLHDWLGRTARRLPDGTTVPLVRDSRTLVDQRLVVTGRTDVPGGIRGLWIAGIAGAVLMVGALAWVPVAAQLLASIWAAIAGLGGVVLLLLWVATDHTVAAANENLLLLSIAALPLAVLVWVRGAGGFVGNALAAIVAISALIGCVFVFSPLHQHNAEVLALAVPLDLGLALVVRRFSRAAIPKS